MLQLKPGDYVRIKSGPFADFVSIVDSVDAAEGVLIAKVEIFGRATPIEIALCAVERVEPGAVLQRPLTNLN